MRRKEYLFFLTLEIIPANYARRNRFLQRFHNHVTNVLFYSQDFANVDNYVDKCSKMWVSPNEAAFNGYCSHFNPLSGTVEVAVWIGSVSGKG